VFEILITVAFSDSDACLPLTIYGKESIGNMMLNTTRYIHELTADVCPEPPVKAQNICFCPDDLPKDLSASTATPAPL